MSHRYTVIGRRNAFLGPLLGVVAFVLAFPLLFWNEGRAVATYNSLTEGAQKVMSVNASALDPVNEGKLVHVIGRATTDETLTDPDFRISVKALRLQRQVQMCQWQESSRSSSGNTTTYTYSPTWSDTPILSRNFQQPSGHDNPDMPYQSADYIAQKVTVQAFTLAPDLTQKMSGAKPLAVDALAYAVPDAIKDRTRIVDGLFYIGSGTLDSPQVGDLQVKFNLIDPTTVSVIAMQAGNGLVPYPARAGDALALVAMSEQSAAAMFKTAQEENDGLTWALRGAGVLAMFVGLILMSDVLVGIANLIPFLGILAQGAWIIFALVFTTMASALVIALAWLFYRPLIGLAILGLGVLVGGLAIGSTLAWTRWQKQKEGTL